jgi:hypothetical protein
VIFFLKNSCYTFLQPNLIPQEPAQWAGVTRSLSVMARSPSFEKIGEPALGEKNRLSLTAQSDFAQKIEASDTPVKLAIMLMICLMLNCITLTDF